MKLDFDAQLVAGPTARAAHFVRVPHLFWQQLLDGVARFHGGEPAGVGINEIGADAAAAQAKAGRERFKVERVLLREEDGLNLVEMGANLFEAVAAVDDHRHIDPALWGPRSAALLDLVVEVVAGAGQRDRGQQGDPAVVERPVEQAAIRGTQAVAGAVPAERGPGQRSQRTAEHGLPLHPADRSGNQPRPAVPPSLQTEPANGADLPAGHAHHDRDHQQLEPAVEALNPGAEQPGRSQRNQGQRDDHRHHHREAYRDPGVLHPRGRAPLGEEEEGHEDADRRQGRGQDRHADFAAANMGGLIGCEAVFLTPAENALQHHHGRIDQHPHRQHQAHHGDHVEGDGGLKDLAGDVHADKDAQCRGGDGEGDDNGRADIAQKDEDDDHRQKRAEQRRIDERVGFL